MQKLTILKDERVEKGSLWKYIFHSQARMIQDTPKSETIFFWISAVKVDPMCHWGPLSRLYPLHCVSHEKWTSKSQCYVPLLHSQIDCSLENWQHGAFNKGGGRSSWVIWKDHGSTENPSPNKSKTLVWSPNPRTFLNIFSAKIWIYNRIEQRDETKPAEVRHDMRDIYMYTMIYR